MRRRGSKFESNSQKRMWLFLWLHQTSKRHHLGNRFNYQSLFKKGSCTHLKPDLCTREISAKQRRRAFHYYFFECTFKGYYTAKNGDVLLSTPLICTVLFIWESPRVLKITVQGHSLGSVNIGKYSPRPPIFTLPSANNWQGRDTCEGCFDLAKHSLSGNISVMFEAMLSLSAYFTDHCLVSLCTFLGDSQVFQERDYHISSQRIG